MPKKNIVLAAVLILVVGATAYLLLFRDTNKSLSTDNPESSDISDDYVNMNPPTEQEKTDTDQHKDDIAEQPTTNSGGSTSGKKTVNVVVTFAETSNSGTNFEASAYAETLDSSGTCTIKMKKGSTTVSASETALPNVSTMSCGDLKIARSKLSAGEWQMTISYSSTKSQGSTTQTVSVK